MRAMLKILILAALPQEYAPLKKLIPTWRLLCRKPFKQFVFSLPGMEIRLIESGMGGDSARGALEWAFAQSRPDLFLFVGFCGGLHPDLHIGDVCVVERSMAVHPHGKAAGGIFAFRFPGEFSEWLCQRNVKAISAVTISSPEDKSTLAELAARHLARVHREAGEFTLPEQEGQGDNAAEHTLAGVDMETFVLAGIGCREQLPFLCLRSVSDELGDQLGFDLSEISGPGGKVKIGKVLKTIMLNPKALKAFFLAWRRSNRAGKNLCAILADFLTAPSDSLRGIARGIRIECD
jgi:nucleoside phosphorylase